MSRDFAYLARNGKNNFCLSGGGDNLPFGQTSPMTQNRIRELRKARGLTLEELSEKTGLSPSYVQRLEDGKRNLGTKHFDNFATALAVSPRELLEGEPSPETPAPARIIRPSGPESSEVVKVGEGWPDTGEEWMDVRGVTVGGDDSFFYFGDVIDQVRRPPGIRNAKNVAALNVAGESMVPRFAPGELIYVQHRAPAPGDDVVVELYPENDGDPPKSFLKRLVRKTGPRLYCRQFNPASDLEFDNGEVKILWRVLTLRDLLG
jgi:phage repressor protein C with HTH and peptisase S24 domain